MTTGLKPLDEVFEPDARNITLSSAEISDFHNLISEIRLTGHPPKAVARHFEVARNLFLYSWFVYDFSTPAEAQAYASVEFALKERHKVEEQNFGNRSPGLKRLFESAVNQGWVKDGGFPHLYEEQHPAFSRLLKRKQFDPEGKAYCKILLNSMPFLRNSIAHGDPYLVGPGGAFLPLEICAAIINQLFP